MESDDATVLFRPVGPEELKLIEESGFTCFPPRLAEQPIFYPVLTEEYAVRIARDWNVPASGAGYVTRFSVRTSFLSKYAVQCAGGQSFAEYWIPSEDLPDFNRNILGRIQVIAKFE